jgi:UDP-2-acetamido-2-deoxy-ribo-hexuluronate aminotransferase
VNSRLDTLQAAILEVKLRYLADYTRRRNEAADVYDRELGNLPKVKIPARAKSSTHVFHQYTIRVSERRNELKTFLEEQGIPTMIYYPVPLHLQKGYFRPEFPRGSFPVTERLSDTVLSLPIHTEMTVDELNFISTSIRNFYQ